MRMLRTLTKWNLILFALMILGAGQAFCETTAKAQPTAASQSVVAKKPLPLWELGISAAAARLPHYIGSDEYRNYIVPFPYVIYRGDILKADREGIRGIFYRSKRFETSLSFGGNPPVSEDNEAREGMPQLEAIGEVGPALRYDLYRKGRQERLFLQAAVRSAWSFDFQGGLDIDIDNQGWRGGLDLKYHNHALFAAQRLSIFLKAGINFADEHYNDYFYGVTDQFATAERPAYDADAGYAGFSLSASCYKALTDRLGVGGYTRWSNISGAAFEDSPLVKEKNNYAVGALFVWKFAISDEPAP